MLKQCFKSMISCVSLMLALMSCTNCYKMDGVVETLGYEGRELSLVEFLPHQITKFDSCRVVEGHFKMKGHIDSTRLVFLCKDGRPIIPLYMEKGHIRISLQPTEMTASGTRQNDLFYSFLKEKIAIDNHYEDLFQQSMRLSRRRIDPRKTELLQDSLRIIVDECENMICAFMAQNYSEPAAVGVFMMLSSSPSTSDDISPLLRRILDAAPDDFLSQSYVNGFINRVGYERN